MQGLSNPVHFFLPLKSASAVNRSRKYQHLEAEMGMINHRHDVLKRESQALWRVVLQEGGQRLTEKAIYALRQTVRD